MDATILADTSEQITAPRRYELTRGRVSFAEKAIKEIAIDVASDTIVRRRLRDVDFQNRWNIKSRWYRALRYREYDRLSLTAVLQVVECLDIEKQVFKKFWEARYAAALQ